MIAIIDERNTGKTEGLMHIAQRNNALFVCKDPRHMRAKAEAYGIQGLEFVSYSDFLLLNYESEKKNVVVDELSELVNQMVHPLTLVGYTITNED
jgi:hypothetical protein